MSARGSQGFAWVCALSLTLIGCAGIPPKLAPPALRDAAPLAGLPVPAGGAWPDPEWWKRYADPQLDALVAQALQSAPTLAQAQARVALAEQQIAGKRAAGAPYVGGSAGITRQRLSENGLFPLQFLGFTWYSQADIGAQFQYDFDWWGKQRAIIKASVDQARAASADRSAAYLVLTSSVADTYFGWLADQARLVLARQLVAGLAQQQRLAQARAHAGLESSDPGSNAAVDLQAARQQISVLEGSAQLRKANLAALLGVASADLPALSPHSLPRVTATLPDDARLALIGRRPDIAASRWRVEAMSQQVAEARAAFYPDISIKALVGLSSIDLGALFSPASRIASLVPAISLPLFDGGRRKAAYGATRAQLALAIADYDAAVVAAAHDVATQALALQQLSDQRAQQREEIAAVQRLRETARARVKQGVADDRSLLVVEARLLRERDAALTLDARALSSEVGLTKALGGGYRNSTDASDAGNAANYAPSNSNAADGTQQP
jgi:multidrug efflux system outer membrane protein